MQPETKPSSRKKFLLWSAAVLASVSASRLFSGSKKKEDHPTRTVKMLTQDGRLVEVDAGKIYCGKRKKISDEQLKVWVNKKS